jgi:hypothetical protein
MAAKLLLLLLLLLVVVVVVVVVVVLLFAICAVSLNNIYNIYLKLSIIFVHNPNLLCHALHSYRMFCTCLFVFVLFVYLSVLMRFLPPVLACNLSLFTLFSLMHLPVSILCCVYSFLVTVWFTLRTCYLNTNYLQTYENVWAIIPDVLTIAIFAAVHLQTVFHT